MARSRARGQRGEVQAARWLERHGFTIVEEQATRTSVLMVDGQPCPFEVRADFVVRKSGRRIAFETMRIFLLMVLMAAVVRAAPPTRDAARGHVNVDVTYDQQPRRSPRVWVNTRSGVYHCPGSKWYGIGKRGAWMTEREARAKGYRTAYKRACGT